MIFHFQNFPIITNIPYIYRERPYVLNWDEAVDLGGDYTATWGEKTYQFYKDQKIKDIYKEKDGHQIENYTRP